MTTENYRSQYVLEKGMNFQNGVSVEELTGEVDPWLSYLHCRVSLDEISAGPQIDECPDKDVQSYENAIEDVFTAVVKARGGRPAISIETLMFMNRVGLAYWPRGEFDFKADYHEVD